ncbi:MAG: S9 family peptidase [Saprospiraceae bacterium]|nr:S9 family peptidase [Saprospiraceae bacterium]
MRILLFLIAILSLFSGTLVSQAGFFNYTDVYDLQFATNASISPDGSTIIYNRVQYDIMTDKRYSNLWSIATDGSNHTPITSGKNNYSQIIWSPDGKQIAYTSNEEGKSQIFIRWMDSGAATSITNLTSAAANLKWSPDGNMLLFSRQIDEPMPMIGKLPSPPEGATWAAAAKVIRHVGYKEDGTPIASGESYTQLFIINVSGGAPRQITSKKANHSQAQWTPDGKSIVFTADFKASSAIDINNEYIYRMDVSSGDTEPIVAKRGPYNHVVLSPDGTRIAYAGYVDKFLGYQQPEIHIIDMKGNQQQVLTDKLDRDPEGLQWSTDGKSIFFMYDEYGVTKLANINMDGNLVNIASGLGGANIGRPYSGGYFTISKNGKYVYSKTDAQNPAELVTGHFPTKMAETQITRLNGQLLMSRKTGKVESFWVNSTVDKTKVQGWIITPPDFDKTKKYPLILEIHGGPYTAYGPVFSPELQLMASQGYVIVYTNPRGSTSYGADFSAYINHNYPSEDYNDLMDCVDFIAGKGYIDDTKLFITGGSGGGVLTAWSIGKTDRFAAAVVAKPVINWYTHTLTADSYPYFSKYWFTKMPWEDPDQYMKRSPISLVGSVKTPTMLLTGDLDHRTPISESEQYYQALKLRDIDAAMVRIADEGHEMMSRPSNLLRKVAYIIGWFDEHKSK